MSEEPKITSVVKTKDPKKVASGKRLAAMSKQAKQAKKEALAQTDLAYDSASENININNVGLMVSIVGTVVGVAGLYYMYYPTQTEGEVKKSVHSNDDLESTPSTPPTTVKPATQAKPSKTKLDSFD